MVVPAISSATCKEVDVETLVKRLRDEGYGYTAISEMVREQLGVEVTASDLVRRVRKRPNTSESVGWLSLNMGVWNWR
jgi:intein-encoded DNA endonuclease-like protein